MKLFAFLLPLVVLSSLMLETSTAHAQDGTRTPIADGTLGTQVFGGNGNFAITGGVSRGQNLFHSFQDFSVPTNGSATFINPVDNRSIITRVTGGMFSDINGLVSTQGANFLLINPNGVVFGPNVRLDVGRLFLASTASSIDLVDGGGRTVTFGTNPLGDTPFLTVNPNVLFNVSRLNLGGGGGEIRNFGVLQTGNANQYIGLIGGNVTVSGGQINALGGRVELGGLSAPGSVALGVEGNSPRVSIPQDVTRSNVVLTNRALVAVAGNGGGDIAINARNVQLFGASSLLGGIFTAVGTPDTVAGDINLKATERILIDSGSNVLNAISQDSTGQGGNVTIEANNVTVQGGSILSASTFGLGSAGNVTVSAGQNVSILGSNIFSTVEVGGSGRGGNVNINADSLSLQGAGLQARTRGRDGFETRVGNGNAGNINLKVNGITDVVNSIINSTVGAGVVGDAGNISINTGSLFLNNGTQLTSSTFGMGNAGNVTIIAKDSASFDRTDIFSTIGAGGIGKGGNITVEAGGSFSLQTGSSLQSRTFSGGQGDAGNVNVKVAGILDVAGTEIVTSPNGQTQVIVGGINSSIEVNAIGNAGSVHVEAGSLSLNDSSFISSSTAGRGNAGNVTVVSKGSFSLANNTEVTSEVKAGGVGRGGNIDISSNSLSLKDGSQLRSATREATLPTRTTIGVPAGRGDAGNINVKVTEAINLSGVGRALPSAIGSSTEVGTEGNAGNITVEAGSVSLKDNAFLRASTSGRGNAGNVAVTAKDSVLLVNGSSPDSSSSDSTFISSEVRAGGVGKGGNISINASSLTLQDGANLLAATREAIPPTETQTGLPAGRGDAGNVNVQVTGAVTLSGVDRPSSFISSDIRIGAEGNGGNINIDTGSLSLQNKAFLSAFSGGQGNAGNVFLTTKEAASLTNAQIFSNKFGSVGKGGNVTINADSLSLKDTSSIVSTTSGEGNAGNVAVTAKDAISLDGNSEITSEVLAGGIGKGGNIDITSNSLSLKDGSQLRAATREASPPVNTQSGVPAGRGDAGNINVKVAGAVDLSGIRNNQSSAIGSDVLAGTEGNAGNITVEAGSVSLKDNAFLRASTSGRGNAGNVAVTAKDSVLLVNGSSPDSSSSDSTFISSEVRAGGVGKGGNISINASSLTLQDGANLLAATREAIPPTETQTGLPAGRGDAGNVNVQVTGAVTLSGVDRPSSFISSDIRIGAEGNGGNINIDAGSLSLQNKAFLSAFNGGQGNAGNVFLTTKEAASLTNAQIFSNKFGSVGKGGNVTINADSLSLKDTSSIVSTTSGEGNAGNVAVTAKDAISLDGNSEITSEVLAGGIGKGGNIDITSNSLSLKDGSQLRAATREASPPVNTQSGVPAGRGDAGNINVKVAGAVDLSGIRNNQSSAIGSDVLAGTEGNAGNITVEAGSVSLKDNAFLRASTSGRGNAGNVAVTAKDSVLLVNGSSPDSSSSDSTFISSEVRAGGVGKGGNVSINASSLTLQNGANVLAATREDIPATETGIGVPAGRGDAGNVSVQVTDAVTLSGVGNSSSFIASDIRARAEGNGGDVNVNAGTLSLKDGAFLTASTNGQGNAGRIAVNANNSLLISGKNGENSSRLSVSSGSNTGTAGDVTVNSPRITLENSGRIESTSNSGSGGNIDINNKINAPLSANSIPAGGDTLILRSGAQISANSRGESQEGSSGGNININSNFIIAVPSENSDITANANRGRGGNININAQLFGIQNRPSNPNNSGITASSEFGQSGNINLNTLGIDPGKDIGELPVTPIDASKQIAQACSSSQLSNKFYITGRGGHPPNANEQLSSEAIWSDPRNTKPQIASNSNTPTSNKLPEPAIRMVFDGKGNASLIANNSDAETNSIKIACPNSHKLSASSTQ